MRARDRLYFILIGVACAAGWSLQLWLLPLVAFVLCELVLSVPERVVERARARPAAGAVPPDRRAAPTTTYDRAA